MKRFTILAVLAVLVAVFALNVTGNAQTKKEATIGLTPMPKHEVSAQVKDDTSAATKSRMTHLRHEKKSSMEQAAPSKKEKGEKTAMKSHEKHVLKKHRMGSKAEKDTTTVGVKPGKK